MGDELGLTDGLVKRLLPSAGADPGGTAVSGSAGFSNMPKMKVTAVRAGSGRVTAQDITLARGESDRSEPWAATCFHGSEAGHRKCSIARRLALRSLASD